MSPHNASSGSGGHVRPVTAARPSSLDHVGLEQIEDELARLLIEGKQRWQRMATLIMHVDQHQLWRQRTETFSGWVHLMAARVGVKSSHLWRCLKAGRYYEALQRQAQSEGRPTLPNLEAITASPESLELCEKIARVASDRVTRVLVDRAVSGDVTRKELRQLWELYRPATLGQTARGRGATPLVDHGVDSTRDAHMRTETISKLRIAAGEWLGQGLGIEHHRIWTHVNVPMPPPTLHAVPGGHQQPDRVPPRRPEQSVYRAFDAVVLVHTKDQLFPQLHGFMIHTGIGTPISDGEYADFSAYVDHMWVAVPRLIMEKQRPLWPTCVGVVVIGGAPQVLCSPTRTPRCGRHAGELARLLLLLHPL